MKVHLFGATSSPGCANYGLKHLAKENKAAFPLGSNFIEHNFYVDDGLISEPTKEQAIQVVEQARTLCATGGLRLHKFVSNNRTVMESIPLSERAADIQNLDLNFDNLPNERALGMEWSVESDTLHFSFTPTERPTSRRGILATVASLYDPLGLIAPCVFQGKKLLQDMCRKGIGWDDPPPKELQQKWEDWKTDLKSLKSLQIPRCYYPQEFNASTSKMELHHFSDASLAGYGTCTYLRVQDQQDNVHCSLVMAKARVAPIKVMTVPRLELSAALVAAEVSAVLKKELHLPITQEVFWTDSKVVLGYLNNDARKFHIFVANRIQKIKQLTRPEQWHYVPSNMNPADHASRGMSTSEITTTRWLTGPAFLWKKEPETPNQPKFELQAGDPEVRTKTTLATQAAIPFDWNARLTHCSTWDHAIRAVARVGRWRKGSKTQEPLSVEELEKAEMIVIKGLQAQTFLQERTHLSENVTLPKSSSLHQLDPIVQDGLIRVGGRLKHASMPNHERHPVVLPKRGHVTNLIIDHCHKRTAHQGRGHCPHR